jgi:hypothetical protein
MIVLTEETAALEAAERAVADLEETRETAPDHELFRGRMPKANGDQDAW